MRRRVEWIFLRERRTYPNRDLPNPPPRRASTILERGERPLVLGCKKIIPDAGSVGLDVRAHRYMYVFQILLFSYV